MGFAAPVALICSVAARRARLGLISSGAQGHRSPSPQHDHPDRYAQPHRHLDLPLQAPAAEAEGGAVGGTSDRDEAPCNSQRWEAQARAGRAATGQRDVTTKSAPAALGTAARLTCRPVGKCLLDRIITGML